jgi:hypothetical protein
MSRFSSLLQRQGVVLQQRHPGCSSRANLLLQRQHCQGWWTPPCGVRPMGLLLCKKCPGVLGPSSTLSPAATWGTAASSHLPQCWCPHNTSIACASSTPNLGLQFLPATPTTRPGQNTGRNLLLAASPTHMWCAHCSGVLTCQDHFRGCQQSTPARQLHPPLPTTHKQGSR